MVIKNGGRVKMSSCVKASDRPKAQQAQWNVQVVRGKVTTRCLWNACKALSIGLLLLAIGTTMAVIGYYADQLSIRSELRGNSTVRVRNESRGFHLNNLSYAGPIVMGVGGFIVVAACVMTFEARDSAAKVVPARFKANLNAPQTAETSKTTPRAPRSHQKAEPNRTNIIHTPLGDGKPKSSRSQWSPNNDPLPRMPFLPTSFQASRGQKENSSSEGDRRGGRRTKAANLNKSPSAPDLTGDVSELASPDKDSSTAGKGSFKAASRKQRESVRPSETASGNLFLRPNHLQRQALSMDNPFYDSCHCCTPPSARLSRQHSRRSAGSRDSFDADFGSSAGVAGSQTSMALDLHECQVTLQVKDESVNKRSDTARRHQLLRQKPVDDDSHSALSKCSCPAKFLWAPPPARCGAGTKLSPCHHRRRPTAKMTADFRSQSFSQACSCCLHEGGPKVFCIDDHRRSNRSSDNIRLCCDEKLRSMRRHSPCISPLRSPQQQKLDSSKSLPHRAKVSPKYPGPRRPAHKLEGSLSAEEQYTPRTRPSVHPRSGSFSPTGHGALPRDETPELLCHQK